MICERCGYRSRLRNVLARDGNWMQRCEYCGTSHSCADDRPASAISPRMLPVAIPGGVLSPWMDARYKPCRAGVFDCEFRDGTRLRLAWDGRAWMWTGQVVDTTELLKWRGKWITNG